MDNDSAREIMVDSQIRTIDVTDPGVLGAFAKIKRESFVPESWRQLAYCDSDIPMSDRVEGRALPAAGAWARLVQLLAPAPADKILLVGCAGGYGAAILGALAGEVVALEPSSALVENARAALVQNGIANVTLACGAFTAERCFGQTFDGIIFEGAIDQYAGEFDQLLGPQGRMVVVVGHGRAGRAMLYRRHGQNVSGQPAFDAALPALPGFQKPERFEFALEAGAIRS